MFVKVLLVLSCDFPQNLQNLDSSSISFPQCLQYIIFLFNHPTNRYHLHFHHDNRHHPCLMHPNPKCGNRGYHYTVYSCAMRLAHTCYQTSRFLSFFIEESHKQIFSYQCKDSIFTWNLHEYYSKMLWKWIFLVNK